MTNSWWPHGLQRARLPCPSPSPRVCSNSRPLIQGNRITWCFILCISLSGLRDAQLADKALFLHVCEDVSWSKLAFELVNWIKQMVLPNVGGHHPSIESLNTTKQWRKCKHSLPSWTETSITSCSQVIMFLALGCSDPDWDFHHQSPNSQASDWVWITPPPFLGLQLMSDHGTSWFP